MVHSLSGSTALVTGGLGFIGSALVRNLLEDGNDVTIVDNLRTGYRSNAPQSESYTGSLTLVEGDLREIDLVEVMREQDIQYVFHLAARPYVPNSYDQPHDFLDANVKGTIQVLLACDETDVERVVSYSSSEVYGTAQRIPMDEKHRLHPQSTYAVSKLAADRLCYTQYEERDVPVIILRQFNCYGPRETHPYVVPEIIAQLSRSNELTLGNIHAKRDLTYVDDAVRGACKLITREAAEGSAVNLGYGNSIAIEDLARLIGELMGHESISISVADERRRACDVENLVCDNSRAESLIDYAPRTDLREGLSKTIDWYRTQGAWAWEREGR